MSKYVTYIHLEQFVRQWLTHSYGSPAAFPAQSVENSTIRRFTQKRPDTPLAPDDGDTPVCVPDSKAKDPAVFNYLGKHAQGRGGVHRGQLPPEHVARA